MKNNNQKGGSGLIDPNKVNEPMSPKKRIIIKKNDGLIERRERKEEEDDLITEDGKHLLQE